MATKRKPTPARRAPRVIPKYAVPEASAPPSRRRVAFVPAPAAPKLTQLAFLPHAAEDLSPLTFPGVDPGIYEDPVKYLVHKPLQDALAAVMKKAAFSSMQVTLVDLTSGADVPQFAGHQHKGMTQIASVAKLIPMVAAFQLQQDLRAFQAEGSFATRAELFAEARRRWLATQTPASGAPVETVTDKLGRMGDLVTWNGKPIKLPAKGSELPKLEVIFKDDLSLDFATWRIGLTEGPCDEYVALSAYERFKLTTSPDLSFLHRMKLMVGFSDNAAAASCIRDLGHPYLISAMLQQGLWDPARGGGLWLGSNYGPVPWLASPISPMGHNGNAGSLAALMTLLARGILVNVTASLAMQEMLDKRKYPGLATRSGFAGGLSSFADVRVLSKLGLLPGREYDCALIERMEGSAMLRYVAVGLNGGGTQVMKDLIVELDKAIQKSNGLI